MTVQELLRRLPELSKEDLDKVRHRVQLLTGSTGASPSKAKEDGDWFVLGFGNELRRRGYLAGTVPNNCLPSKWEEKAAPVREYLLKGFNKKLNTTERVAIAQLAAERLIDYVQPWAERISPKFIFSMVDRVPAALEASFPGYWAARSLHFCLLYKGSSSTCLRKS